MPKLWSETVDEHRRTVRASILETTAALVAEHGLGVTMSQIAQRVGIGRATLYKYFPDVDAIMVAWHERQVGEHLRQVGDAAARHTDAGARLRAVLTRYAELSGTTQDHPAELAAPLHRAPHMRHARHELHGLITRVIAAAAEAGAARGDVPAAELATYCLHALTAAAALPSRAARDRLVAVTLTGIAPPPA